MEFGLSDFSFGPVKCKELKHHLPLDEENFNHQNEIKQKLGKAVFNEEHYRERWHFPSLCVCVCAHIKLFYPVTIRELKNLSLIGNVVKIIT